MKRLLAITVLVLSASAGCHRAPPPVETPTALVPVAPDNARLEQHLREHVTYPADRATILAACAQTNEFSPAEKAWIAEHLPPGTYGSGDAAIEAIRPR